MSKDSKINVNIKITEPHTVSLMCQISVFLGVAFAGRNADDTEFYWYESDSEDPKQLAALNIEEKILYIFPRPIPILVVYALTGLALEHEYKIREVFPEDDE